MICTIEIDAKITINPNINSLWHKTAYGHEQRHIESVRKEALNLKKDLEDKYESTTKGVTHEKCTRQKRLANAEGLRRLINIIAKEGAHKNLSSPPDGQPRDPIDGLFPKPTKKAIAP